MICDHFTSRFGTVQQVAVGEQKKKMVVDAEVSAAIATAVASSQADTDTFFLLYVIPPRAARR